MKKPKIMLLIATCLFLAQCKKDSQPNKSEITSPPCINTTAILTFSFKGDNIPYVFDISWGTLQAPDYKKIYTNVYNGFSTSILVNGCKCSKSIDLPLHILKISAMDNISMSNITGYIILNNTDTIETISQNTKSLIISGIGCY